MTHLDTAIQLLRAGKLIAYPTETFYAIGADVASAAAVEEIFVLKHRSRNVAIPLILPDAEWLRRVAAEVPPLASRLVAAFWPGPLTLIVRAASWLPPALTAGEETVAVRVSSHPIAGTLARWLDSPLTATSANASGTPPLAHADEVRRAFPSLHVVPGESPGGAPSTIVDLISTPPRLVRDGAVPWERITRVLGIGP